MGRREGESSSGEIESGRERESVCGIEREIERESESKCVCERERQTERKRESVCVRERERKRTLRGREVDSSVLLPAIAITPMCVLCW